MAFNMKSILPYIAGAGASGLASQFSALSPFQAAIGAGAGALTNSKNPLGGALQGFAGGGVGSSLAGGVKNMFNSGAQGSVWDKFGSGLGSGLQSFGSSIPGFGGVGSSNPTGMFAKMFAGTPSQSDVLKNGTQYYSPNGSGTGYNRTNVALPSSGGSAMPSFTASSATAANNAPASGMSPMNMFKNLIPGMAVAGLGSALSPTPNAPDYSPVKAELLAAQNSANAANAPAIQQYLNTLSAPTGGSAESGVANARLINDRQKAQAQKDIMDQFSANNGSTTGNSAYNTALTKSNAAYDQNYSAQAAQTQFEYDTMQQQQKMAAAQALSGLNNDQLQFYAGLANLDVQTIQDQFQLDAGRAQGLKDIATQAGQLMMEKGLGLGGAK